MELPSDWGDWKNDVEQDIPIDGRDEILELHWTHDDFGGVSLTLGDEEIAVTCEYDNDSWVGGSDGIEIEPPYYPTTEHVTADGDQYVTADPIWSIPAWIIKRLTDADGPR